MQRARGSRSTGSAVLIMRSCPMPEMSSRGQRMKRWPGLAVRGGLWMRSLLFRYAVVYLESPSLVRISGRTRSTAPELQV